jgi:hypothetical protein
MLKKMVKEAEKIVAWQADIYTALHNIHADWIVSGVLALARIPNHGADKHIDVTRELFILATTGYIEAGSMVGHANQGVVRGGANEDAPVVCHLMKVPDDFVSFLSLKAVWVSPAISGNMYWRIDANYGASGEESVTYQEEGTYGTTATGGENIINVQEPANPLSLAGLAKGDYLGLRFRREGSHASDTLDAVVDLFGLLFTYTAEQ